MAKPRTQGLADHLAFLRRSGAAGAGHSGRTLLAHLVGTRALLESFGARPALCDAGLFHSVYGTEFFPAETLGGEARDAVRARIGAEAEQLAWLWCTVRRSSLAANLARGPREYRARRRSGGEWLPLTERQLADLAELWVADAVEQLPRLGGDSPDFTRGLSELAPLASPAARDALRERRTWSPPRPREGISRRPGTGSG